MYRGDFLAGFSLRDSPEWEDWRNATSDRLRRDLDRLLGVLVAHHTDRHEFDDAIEFAQRRLALDPLHEPAHQALIQLYDWTGQRTFALRQYRTCVRTLEAELGVAPLPETTALYDAVRGHRLPAPPVRVPQPSVAAVASNPHPVPAAAVSPERVFVGRTAELARLTDAWTSARSTGRSLAVVGEVGSGKSALLDAFARQLRGEHVAVVTVRGHEGEQALAFAAATDLIRAALPGDPAAGPSLAEADRAALARLLPAAEDAHVHGGLPLDTPGARTRLFDAVRNALTALARGSASPALVVVDDVHWFDEESRDLVAFLVRRPPDHVLLVPTWRGSTSPTTVAAAVADAMRDGTGDMVWLPGLSREDVVELLAGVRRCITRGCR